MLLVQSIQITDKFGFDKQTSEKSRASSETVFVSTDPAAFCVNGLGNEMSPSPPHSSHHFDCKMIDIAKLL